MADTQPFTPDQLASLTREELREAVDILEQEIRGYALIQKATARIADFNFHHWRTALARAERAEGRAEELFGELEEAKQQREDAETERNCQAATDAATIAELQASLAVMTNDRDHLMKSAPTATPPAAPDGAPVLRPFDADISVDNCTVTMRVTAMPEEVRGRGAVLAIAKTEDLKLHSIGLPALYDCEVCLWGTQRSEDTRISSNNFGTPAEATAYAEKVRRLLDAANAQWAERGGER